MILDTEKRTVHEWLSKHTKKGTLNVVTGYFTVGALAYLSKQFNAKIKSFDFILGDIVRFDSQQNRTLNLLNENISLDAALQINQLAQQAVAFLQLDKVRLKTLEPNFCYAKVYLFKAAQDEDDDMFFLYMLKTYLCILFTVKILIKMVYGYIRVSTDKQSLENQKFELSNFAQKRQWTVFKWVEEIISGTKKIEERQLGILLSQMAKGDTLLVSELSRLGRNLLQIMSILNFCI
jgi:hypothetical protein